MTNERLAQLLASGAVKAVGGTTELDGIIDKLRECDEATIVLRKDGAAFGVLIYSAKGSEDNAAIDRGIDVVNAIRLGAGN